MKRTMTMLGTTLFSTTVFTLCAPLAQAGDKPPADSLPLSEIVLMLESKGYTPIIEASYDDDSLLSKGVWEVEAYRDGYQRELKIDPKDGVILSDDLDD